MTNLVACLADENGISHVTALINGQSWENIYLISDKKYSLGCNKDVNFVVTDFTKPVSEVIDTIISSLNGKFGDLEVALNLVSGTGKEHMAILAALLKLGVGIRLMAVTKDGIREL